MRQPESGQTQVSCTPPPISSLQLCLLKSHHGAVSEVPGQLSIFTGENRASHAQHDTEHRKQGEEGDLGKKECQLRDRTFVSNPLPWMEPLLHRHFMPAWHQLEGISGLSPLVVGTCLPVGIGPWHLPLE